MMIEMDKKLPYGDYLRQLIHQSNVKQSDLRSILRERGVFCGENDKKVSGPIIAQTGLSPSEFSALKESHKQKEDNPKLKTRSIEWVGDNTLVESLPDDFDYTELFNERHGSCSLNTPPEFTIVDNDANHVSMDFEMSRKDLMKNFGDNETLHKGRVEFKKDGESVNVTVSMTHTAKETKDFAEKVAEKMIQHFRDTGAVDKEAKVVIISFNDFTNENRVRFLSDLSQETNPNILKFIDTKDIHFSPDVDDSSPEKIEWMKERIDELKMKGKGLHSTFFVKESEYHPFIKLFSIKCDYNFQGGSYKAACSIAFEFPEKVDSSGNAELMLRVESLKFEYNHRGITYDSAKREIREFLEVKKLELYKKYKS